MKRLFIALLTVFCLKASAQTDSRIFYSQLMVVFSDLDKNFEFLKGEQSGSDNDVRFFDSNLALEGTKENSIVVSDSGCSYHAIITDSTSDQGSEYILKAWKEKLADALTGMFTQPAKQFQSEKDPGTNGYQYSSPTINVLLLRHKEDNGSYWIELIIQKN